MAFWSSWFKKEEPKEFHGRFQKFYECAECKWYATIISEEGTTAKVEQEICPNCGSDWSKIKIRICRYWYIGRYSKVTRIESIEEYRQRMNNEKKKEKK